MIAREKEDSRLMRIHRTNTMALSVEIQRTSARLADTRRNQEHRARSQGSPHDLTLHSRDFRYCYCQTDGTRICGCHHLDKDPSKSQKRKHENSYKINCKSSKEPGTKSCRKPVTTFKDQQWKPLTKAEVDELKQKRQLYNFQRVSTKYSDQDLWLLSSVPALKHPDIKKGQQQNLLSLAKIYTNVRPGPPLPTSYWIGKNSPRLTPISQISGDKKNKCKSGKKKKTNKNTKCKENNLSTAVSTFNEEMNEKENIKDLNKDNEVKETAIISQHVEDNEEENEEIELTDDDLDTVVEEFVDYVLCQQIKVLTGRNEQQEVQNKLVNEAASDDIKPDNPKCSSDHSTAVQPCNSSNTSRDSPDQPDKSDNKLEVDKKVENNNLKDKDNFSEESIKESENVTNIESQKESELKDIGLTTFNPLRALSDHLRESISPVPGTQ